MHGVLGATASTRPSLAMRVLIEGVRPHQSQLVRCLDLSAHGCDQLLQAGHVRLLTLCHGIHHIAFCLRTWSCTRFTFMLPPVMTSARSERPDYTVRRALTRCGKMGVCTCMTHKSACWRKKMRSAAQQEVCIGVHAWCDSQKADLEGILHHLTCFEHLQGMSLAICCGRYICLN